MNYLFHEILLLLFLGVLGFAAGYKDIDWSTFKSEDLFSATGPHASTDAPFPSNYRRRHTTKKPHRKPAPHVQEAQPQLARQMALQDLSRPRRMVLGVPASELVFENQLIPRGGRIMGYGDDYASLPDMRSDDFDAYEYDPTWLRV